MNLLITIYFNGPALGVAVYARELLKSLIPKLINNSVSFSILCSHDAYHYLSSELIISRYCVVENKLNSFVSRILFLHRLPENKNTTILHLTNPYSPRLANRINSNVISVIHDLNEFDQRNRYGLVRSAFRRQLLSCAIKNSTSIICISNHTKNQVTKYFNGIRFIEIIHNGAGSNLPVRNRLKKKVILVVGRLDPFGKNLWIALEKIDRWHQQDNELRVVFAGGFNESTADEGKTFLSEIKSRYFIDYVGRISDDFLSSLYATSEFLLFLSKFEGFGLPAFEAINSLCPVVANSENNVLLELIPDQAVFVSDFEHQTIEQIRLMIEKIDLVNAKNFISQLNWDNAAEKYLRHILRTVNC